MPAVCLPTPVAIWMALMIARAFTKNMLLVLGTDIASLISRSLEKTSKPAEPFTVVEPSVYKSNERLNFFMVELKILLMPKDEIFLFLLYQNLPTFFENCVDNRSRPGKQKIFEILN